MVRELNMDTQRQNFWKESINKEATVRLAWHMRFSKEFADSNLQSKAQKNGFLPKLTKVDGKTLNHMETNYRKSSKKYSEPVKDSDDDPDDRLLLVEMRPVSCETRDLLFKGFSALGNPFLFLFLYLFQGR